MSGRYVRGATAVCGECGELIALVAVPAAECSLWIHPYTGQAFCYRDPQRTETAWPDPAGRADITIAEASHRIPAPESSPPTAPTRVLGFIVQCAVCPQKAVVATQPAGEWVCPRCVEVVDADGVVDACIACPSEHPVIANHSCALPEGHDGPHETAVHRWPAEPEPSCDDDQYPISKVWG